MTRHLFFVVLLGASLAAAGCSSSTSGTAAPGPDVAADTAQADATATDQSTADVPALDLAGVELPAAKTWDVATTAAKTFDPASLTIMAGDSVKFTVGPIHTATQVDKATWDANGTTPLSGGFDIAGGNTQTVMFASPGTIYFVCKPHVGMGMKGKITVQ